jgi:hypothetical protein
VRGPGAGRPGQGTRLVGYGLLVGVPAGIALTRLQGKLYQVSASDLATFVGISLLLVSVALLAT